ncbi:MAG: hypothetical protein AAGA18_09370 [Verrucomicrobiota bacterium]
MQVLGRLSILCLGLVLSSITIVVAQQRAIEDFETIERLEGLQKRIKSSDYFNSTTPETIDVPELFASEREDLGPQFIVRRIPRRKWFDAYVDTQYFYSSNVNLAKNSFDANHQDTAVWVNTLQLAIAPDPYEIFEGVALYPSVGFRYQWYNYGLLQGDDHLNRLDFDSQTTFAECRFVIDDLWVVTAGFDWNRLVGHEEPNYQELYREYKPHWGVERLFPLAEDKAVSLGYHSSYHFTDVGEILPGLGQRDRNDRMTHTFSIVYTQVFFEKLFVQPFYNFELKDFMAGLNGDLEEQVHLAGTSVTYFFNDWSNVRAFFTYTRQNSNRTTSLEYEKWDGGGGLSLNFRF